MDLKKEKNILRKTVKEKTASPSGLKIIETSSEMQRDEKYCKAFLERIPGYAEAETVFAYYAMPDEFPTLGLLKQILKDKKKLALPVTEGKNLIFKEVHSENGNPAPLKKGAYGISEPAEECKVIFSALNAEEISAIAFPLLIITPGRAFSENGNRLGHGGGYYDRLFESLRGIPCKYKIFTAGICFSFQLMEFIPAEEFDTPVQNVFTEIVKKNA